jgi:hypothetical protein
MYVRVSKSLKKLSVKNNFKRFWLNLMLLAGADFFLLTAGLVLLAGADSFFVNGWIGVVGWSGFGVEFFNFRHQ